MITIIDYEIGNLRSIEKALQRVGAEVLRTDKPEDLARAERLVLPGVGAFGACVDELRTRGLEQPILDAVERGVPLLGVCVGMQLLFEVSEEMGLHAGLRILPGRVIRFEQAVALAGTEVGDPDDGDDGAITSDRRPLKVPHMGWNQISPHRPSPLLKDIEPGAFFYFVHSYYPAPVRPDDVLASTTYGVAFPAIVAHENVFGVQFHPEKSQHNGLKILDNFAKM